MSSCVNGSLTLIGTEDFVDHKHDLDFGQVTNSLSTTGTSVQQ